MDVVKLKTKVKHKEIEFSLLDGYIYCKDNKTQESVIVGDYKEFKINPDGIVIILEKGKKKVYKTLSKNQKSINK